MDAVLYTAGHGARPIEDFLAMLAAVEVEHLVDVRTMPASRKHPQFGKEALASSLGRAGMAYTWRKDLGGWRKPQPHSPHQALTSASFRGYADYMDTPEFDRAIVWLLREGGRRRTAFMCAESLWWRCHRRMIADSLLARRQDVLHILEGARVERHRLHPNARLVGERVVYDVNTPSS